MAEPSASQKVPLTVHLSAELAKRLKVAAEAQKRAAGDLVVDLLDRHLPRAQGPKVNIPYT